VTRATVIPKPVAPPPPPVRLVVDARLNGLSEHEFHALADLTTRIDQGGVPCRANMDEWIRMVKTVAAACERMHAERAVLAMHIEDDMRELEGMVKNAIKRLVRTVNT
jgi:hypothetical protein